MRFQVGDVVLYRDDPWEMRSWRDSETGALVAGPPSCPVTVEAVNDDGSIDIAWFYPGFAALNRETYHSQYFDKV
jgi:hypothetical protein